MLKGKLFPGFKGADELGQYFFMKININKQAKFLKYIELIAGAEGKSEELLEMLWMEYMRMLIDKKIEESAVYQDTISV